MRCLGTLQRIIDPCLNDMSDPGIADATQVSRNVPNLSDEDRRKAAEIIQKTYRGHRARRKLRGHGLDPTSRWYEAVKDAKYQEITRPQPPPDPTVDVPADSPVSPARQNWRRVTEVARRAGGDDEPLSVSETSEDTDEDELQSPEDREIHRKRLLEARERRKETAKMMDLQYFLEMVDHKHRHGSNLRKYHAHWKMQDTNQNFFYWLDQGDGMNLSLEECSRERLDSMQVRYLSREERFNYLVKVDKPTGRLVWAKNGEYVWTRDELYKDSMKGIVPAADSTPVYKTNVPATTGSSSDTSSADSDDEDESTRPDEGEQYINEDFHRARGLAKIKYVSAGVLFNHMIRSGLQKGHKWIFVADTSFRLYVGYKQAGAFQHSSFLHGSRILAAGQIKVKHGQLRRLSPLSGHYRPPAKNFRAFVDSLKDARVDMSRVSISQSYAVLVGLEGYVKTRRHLETAEASISHQKDKILHPEKVKQEEEAQKDSSRSAMKERQYLEQQRIAQRKAAEEVKAAKSPKARISRLFKHMRLKNTTSSDHERLPEDGAPPPEGDLIRR